MLTMQRGMALYYGGRLTDAVDVAVAELRRAQESGLDYLLAGWLNILGRSQLDRGYPATAVVTLGRVVAEASEASGGAHRAIARNVLIEAHALLGQVTQARHAAEELGTQPANVPWHPAGLAQLSEGHLAWAEGRPGDALELFTEAYRRAAPANSSIALVAAHTVARYGPRRCGLELARELPAVQGPLAALRLAHMHALVDRDAAALVPVAEAFGRLGADLLAAEAWAKAAEWAATRGDRRLSTLATRTGHAIRARLEGAQTPDLLSLATLSTVDLTGREREVALLAAKGMTSQAIATALTLSIRTIDNNLAKIYRKLGIKGRRDLPRTLG
jgi:DNA-binding CsgD family transcriptional regulator